MLCQVAAAAKAAVKMKLSHGKGNLTRKDVSCYTGLGGESVMRTTGTIGEGEASGRDGPSAGQQVAEEEEDVSEEEPPDQAPLANALGQEPAPKKQKKDTALTEDDWLQEVKDAMACFTSMKDESDTVCGEKELTELQKEVTKMAQSCKRRSLVHLAKQLTDGATKIKGAALLLAKAKGFRRKKNEGTGKILVSTRETVRMKNDIADDNVPAWIKADIMMLEG